MKSHIMLVIAFFSSASALGVVDGSKTPAENGLAVAVEADRRDSGFGDTESTLLMTLRNRHGEESLREMRNRTLEVEGDGDKSLVIFDTPRDVAGTAFLTFAHKDGSDDQWLYLPALKRVKRIASNNKSGPFMGSEFAYEDISSQEVEEYAYEFLHTEALGDVNCHVIERTPLDDKSGYTRQIVWYDTDEYRPMKIEYYDRKNELLKTLEFSGYQRYLDRFWRASTMTMVNHQTGKSTILDFQDWRFQVGLEDRDFDQSTLARVR